MESSLECSAYVKVTSTLLNTACQKFEGCFFFLGGVGVLLFTVLSWGFLWGFLVLWGFFWLLLGFL